MVTCKFNQERGGGAVMDVLVLLYRTDKCFIDQSNLIYSLGCYVYCYIPKNIRDECYENPEVTL